MEIEKYNSMLKQLNLARTNKLVENYFNIIQEIYNANKNEFKKIIDQFIDNFTCKSYILYSNEKIIYFSDYKIPNDKLKSILKLVDYDNNIEKLGDYKIMILNKNKIIPYNEDNDENNIYIIDDLGLFMKIYDFLLE